MFAIQMTGTLRAVRGTLRAVGPQRRIFSGARALGKVVHAILGEPGTCAHPTTSIRPEAAIWGRHDTVTHQFVTVANWSAN